MQHQRQGWCECLPTALAMVAGVSKDQIIKEVLELTGIETFKELLEKWALQLFAAGAGFPSTSFPYVSICDAYNITCDRYSLPRIYTSDSREFTTLLKLGPITSSSQERTYDLKGKGFLMLLWEEGGSHSVAYEDDMIFDGNLSAPMKQDEYWPMMRMGYPNYTLKQVLVYKKESGDESGEKSTTEVS